MFWAAMAEHAQTLARRVILARKAKGWSKEKLALEAGVVYKTIDRIEKAEVKKPNGKTLDKLADALDINIRLLDKGRPTMAELEEADGPLERIERKLDEILSRLPELEAEIDEAEIERETAEEDQQAAERAEDNGASERKQHPPG